MFSIRTIVVMTAFVAAGLASAAERLVDRIDTEPAIFVTVKAGTGPSHMALDLNEAAAEHEGQTNASPWI